MQSSLRLLQAQHRTFRNAVQTTVKNLQDQHILISGGAGSIGRGVIDAFIAHGANVSVCDIMQEDEAIHYFKDYINDNRLMYNQCDCAIEEEMDKLVENAFNKFGVIDTCCIHHAKTELSPILEENLNSFKAITDCNIFGSFLLAQKAAQNMIANEHEGHLLFTSSWVAESNWPGLVSYCASKAAINSMMKQFALELAQYGIRSNVLSPGIVKTGMALHQYKTDKGYKESVDSSIPLRKMQPLESVVDMFVYMCSKSSDYMNGSVITVDGGCHMVNKHTVPIYYKKPYGD
eukprot:135152_1